MENLISDPNPVTGSSMDGDILERPGHPNPSFSKPGFYEEYHPQLSPDTEFLEQFINSQKWIFARTMPRCPHWYVVCGKGPIEEEFVKFVHHIRAFGYPLP